MTLARVRGYGGTRGHGDTMKTTISLCFDGWGDGGTRARVRVYLGTGVRGLLPTAGSTTACRVYHLRDLPPGGLVMTQGDLVMTLAI